MLGIRQPAPVTSWRGYSVIGAGNELARLVGERLADDALLLIGVGRGVALSRP
jgi:hypothetical protein